MTPSSSVSTRTASDYGAKYAAVGSRAIADSFAKPWHGFGAEIRVHGPVDAGEFVQPVTEVAIVIAGHGEVSRRGGGSAQRFDARPGDFCLCPQGVPVDYLQLRGAGMELLHLYVDGAMDSHFASRTALAAWPYAGGLSDPLVAQIGIAIAQELRQESSGGELLLETLGYALLARIGQRHKGAPVQQLPQGATAARGLSPARLARVLDYLRAHAERALSLDDMANEACLSRFHFARAFKASTGKTPYQYLGSLRLELAKALLGTGSQSVEAIAWRLQFTNASSFSRAFRRETGVTPSAYAQTLRRRAAGHPAPTTAGRIAPAGTPQP